MDPLGIACLSNPLALARRKVSRNVLASSYDRRGGNHDWSNYVRREGREAVMMDATGPGCVTRIWTADPQLGTLRIYIDENPTPIIEMPFPELFKLLPLASGIGGEGTENYGRSKAENLPMGQTTYCPIPFQNRCKITIDPEDDYLYYQINASLHPPGTQIDSFDPATFATDADLLESQATFQEWSIGKPLVDMSDIPANEVNLEAGQEHILLIHEGVGAVTGIRLKLPELNLTELAHVRENLWLVAHFDDDEPRDPSIKAPIGPMFLDYGQHPKPRSLFIGTDETGEYYCFFAMPFHRKVSIKLMNRSILPVRLSASILIEEFAVPDHELLRFRASWNVHTPSGPDHRDYDGLACRLLNLSGLENMDMLCAHSAGHLVGCGVSYNTSEAPTDRSACEGDEMFFIDDDPRLTMYGTGFEDYLNDAWGMRGYVGPLSGDATAGELGTAHMMGYRLHVSDPVPFTRKGRFTFEHGTGNNCSGLFQAVAFWYMDPAHTRTRTEEWRWNDLRTGKRKQNQDDD